MKSLEELLALLGDDIPHQPINQDDVGMFIADFEVSASSTEKVRTSVIYAYYLSWKQAGYGTEDPPLSDRMFFKSFGKKFERHRWGDRRFYKIAQGSFEVTRWELEEIKRNIKKRRLRERARKRLSKRKGT